MTDSVAPLPCLFCKSTRVGGADDLDVLTYAIECYDCHARGPFGADHEEAVEHWNRRSPPSDLVHASQRALEWVAKYPLGKNRDAAIADELYLDLHPLVDPAKGKYAVAIPQSSPEGSDTPMQPLHVAPDGMLRFRVNPIVRFLLDNNGRGEYAGKRIDMNELACVDATDDEFAQFAELIGYSLGGYSELSYVTDERYAKAEAQKAALSQGNAALSDQEERDQ